MAEYDNATLEKLASQYGTDIDTMRTAIEMQDEEAAMPRNLNYRKEANLRAIIGDTGDDGSDSSAMAPDQVNGGGSDPFLEFMRGGTKEERGDSFLEFMRTPLPTRPAEKKKDSVGLLDFGKTAVAGALESGGSFAQGVGDLAVRGANALGANMAPAINPLKSASDSLRESRSNAAKELEQQTQLTGNVFDPTTWDAGKTPSITGYALNLTNVLGQFAPNLLLGIATGGSSLAMQAASGAVFGGAQAYGSAMQEEKDKIIGMSHDDLFKESAVYRDLIGRGVDKSLAKSSVADLAGLGGGLGNGVPSAAEGALENVVIGMLTKGKIKWPGALGKSAAGRAATGAVGGFTTGATEEVGEKVAQNFGYNTAIGAKRALGDDTLGDFVYGGLAEGTVGSVLSAASKPKLSDITAAPDSETAAKAAQDYVDAPIGQAGDSIYQAAVNVLDSDAQARENLKLQAQADALRQQNQRNEIAIAGTMAQADRAENIDPLIKQQASDLEATSAVFPDGKAPLALTDNSASNGQPAITVDAQGRAETPEQTLSRTIAQAERANAAATANLQAVQSEEQTQQPGPTVAQGTGGTNAITATLGGTTANIPDSRPAKNYTVQQAAEAISTPGMNTSVKAAILKAVESRIGADNMELVRKYQTGKFDLTKAQQTHVENLIATDAGGQSDLIVRATGEAFKTQPMATLAMRQKGLQDTHQVIQVADGFAIQPKPATPSFETKAEGVAQQQARDNEAGQYRTAISEQEFADLEDEPVPPTAKQQPQQQRVPTTNHRDAIDLKSMLAKDGIDADIVLENTNVAMGKTKVGAGVAKVLRGLGKMLGKQVVFFSSPQHIPGAAVRDNKNDNRIWINVNDSVSPVTLLGHETLHKLQQQSPVAYAALRKAVHFIISDAQLAQHWKDYYQADPVKGKMTDEQISKEIQKADTREAMIEEMLGDLAGNRFGEVEFWTQVFDKIEQNEGREKAKPLIAKLKEAVLLAIGRIQAAFKGGKFDADSYLEATDHLDAVRKALSTAYAAYINDVRAGKIDENAVVNDAVGQGNLLSLNRTADRIAREDGIRPYISQPVEIPIEESGARYSVRRTGSKFDERTGLWLNQDGTANLYLHTTVDESRRIQKEKTLKDTDGTGRVTLTNESSAWRVIAPGEEQQGKGGVVMIKIDPSLLHEMDDTSDDPERKMFFVPVSEGAAFKAKMQLWAIYKSRHENISPDVTHKKVTAEIAKAAEDWKAATVKDRREMLRAAKKILLEQHNIGTLMTENGKLESTRDGEFGLTDREGRGVDSLGLGMAAAQRLSDNWKSCPRSAKCEGVCLGDTAGGNMQYGGVGKGFDENSAFRSGPRLQQYLKTEAFLMNPYAFAIKMQAEIDSLRNWDKKEGRPDKKNKDGSVTTFSPRGYSSAIRLNVTSDIPPSVWQGLIEANPEVTFYDYTKLETNDPVAENHHLTYSSEGVSQEVQGEKVLNDKNNWDRLRARRLDKGFNVAMAFSHSNKLPKFVIDEVTGNKYEVWDGDNYDARYLDPKSKNGLGLIIGLTKKDATVRDKEAAKKSGGFFVDYDPAIHGDTVTIKNQAAFKGLRGIPITTSPAISEGGAPKAVSTSARTDAGLDNNVAPESENGKFSPAREDTDHILNLLSSYDESKLGWVNLSKEEADAAETAFLSSLPEGARRHGRGSGLVQSVRNASDVATDELGGNPEVERSHLGKLGPFSDYSTRATIDDDGTLNVEVWGKEQVLAGLTAEPALTYNITPDNTLIVNGPSPLGKTFKQFKARGWATEATDGDDNVVPGWTRLVGDGPKGRLPLRELKGVLADVHARAKAHRRMSHIGLRWERGTGAFGATDTKGGGVFFSTPRQAGPAPAFSMVDTESENFLKWFKDSKVVDADGKPLVVYHGTARTGISEFSGDRGVAGHFAFDEAIANDWADARYTDAQDSGTDEEYGDGAVVYPAYLMAERVFDLRNRDHLQKAGIADAMRDYTDLEENLPKIKSAGFDSYYDFENSPEDGPTGIAVFSPTQIKSATANTGEFSDSNPDIRYSLPRQQPWYYSALEDGIKSMPAKVSGTSAANVSLWLQSNANKLQIKKDEIQWSGVMDYLAMRGKDKISKEELADWVAGNGVKVTETVLGKVDTSKPSVEYRDGEYHIVNSDGEILDSYRGDAGGKQDAEQAAKDWVGRDYADTKFSGYVLPGGENYKELLITLPVHPDKMSYSELIARKKSLEDAMEYAEGAAWDEMNDEWKSIKVKLRETKQYEFRSSHFDQPNILAHIRMNERTDADGKRVLFIEEIQSDWGQKGKKEGFVSDGKLPSGWTVEQVKVSKYSDAMEWAVFDNSKTQVGLYGKTREEAIKSALNPKGFTGGTPTAPFVTDTKSWTSLALKRAIAYAVDNGFDKIAWTTGEQQASRYDLSKQISKIEYEAATDGSGVKTGMYDLSATSHNGITVINEEDITLDRIEELVGKEIADKIAKDEGAKSDRGGYRNWRILSGLDLKVGGEGMKGFYDMIVPSVAKKLGAEVGEVGVEVFEQGKKSYNANMLVGEIKQQPGFTITPAMKEQAGGKGMPLFSPQRTINPKEDGKDGFWKRLADGSSFSPAQYVAALQGDFRKPGNGSYVGRLQPFGGGSHIIKWKRGIAGFDGYYTFAVKDNDGHFNMLVVPDELSNGLTLGNLHDRAILRYTIFRNNLGKLEFAVSEPNGGTSAYKALDAKGKVKQIDQWTKDGSHQYSRVELGTAESIKLMREVIRRYALERGDIEDISLPNGRDTGANTDRVREFSKDEIKAHFSTPRIIGNSGRQYTPEQLAAFKNVGREVDVPSVRENLRKWMSQRWVQGLVDQFRPLRDLSAKAYALARLSKGASGAFEAFMQHGKLSIKDGAYDADTTGGAMDQVFYPLGKETTDFLYWIAGNRAERLIAEGRERLFSDADIKAAKSLTDGKTDFDYVMRDGSVTRDRTKIYDDSLIKFNEFNKNVMDMAEQSGLIDGSSRKMWEHEFYVPFYRVKDEEGGTSGGNVKKGIVRQQAFKMLKGGTEGLNDLLANTLMNWAHLIDASAKNRAAKETLEAAARVGIARQVASTMARYGSSNGAMMPPGTKGTVWYMNGGNKEEFLVEDQGILTALNGLTYAGLNGPMWDVLTAPKRWLTIGVTASPFFKVRNLIRDSIQAIATSDLSYNPITNVKEGFKLTNRESQEYVSALAGGGLIRFGTMLEGNEASRARQLIKKGAKDAHILDNESKMRRFYDATLEPMVSAYNELGNRGEEINRMSLYHQLRQQKVDHATASLMARDLMDFSMQGSFESVRILSQIVPFFNARLQGMYKLGRVATGTKEEKTKMAITTMAVSLAGLALMAAYGDDDDWKKREEWDRDNYWWFKIGGEAYRIPKPFEIGAVGTLAERVAEFAFNKEMTGERFRKVVLNLASTQLSMNPVPQAFKPILDIYSNRDSFTDRPIESMGMERLDSVHRYNSDTSMPARHISSAIGGAMSPVQIDHLIRGYFSWLGATAVGAADMGIRALNDEPTKPALDYWKLATGGMVQDLDSAGSRYVSWVYDQAKELEAAHATYRQLLKEGRKDEATDYKESNKDKLDRYRSVESVKKELARINERRRMIERSNKDADVKRAEINYLRRQADKISKRLSPNAT